MSDMKKILFSNFENKLFGGVSKNELSIKYASNATAKAHVLEPYSITANFMQTLLTDDEYEKYLSTYYGLESTNKRFIPYQYFDSSSAEIKTRIVLIDNQNCIQEYIPSSPTLTSYETYLSDSFYVVHDNSNVYIFDGASVHIFRNGERPTRYDNSLKVSFVKFYKDKCYFVTNDNPNKIFVSSETDLSKIVKGTLPTETLDFDTRYGTFQDLLICDDCFYIIQDFGIAKIQIKKDETLFSYFKTNARIIKNTAKTVSKYIVFLSSAGLVRFDGNRLVLICDNVISKCTKFGVAESFNNKYYLATQIKLETTINNVLLEIDVDSENTHIFEVGNICELYSIEALDKYFLQAVKSGQSSNETIAIASEKVDTDHIKLIEFNNCYLDSSDIKSINKIRLVAGGRFSFSVTSNTGDKFSYSGTGPFVFDNIGLSGHYFSIKISSMYSFKIESIYIEYMQVEHDTF